MEKPRMLQDPSMAFHHRNQARRTAYFLTNNHDPDWNAVARQVVVMSDVRELTLE